MAAQAELSIADEMEVRPTTKSLVARIIEACNAVDAIKKEGHNLKQNYSYLKAKDVTKAFRRELFNRNVLLILDEKSYTPTRTVRTNSGGEMAEYLLACAYEFHDGESDRVLGPFGAFGVGMDSGDKHVYKAKTGTLKYVLKALGLIPDEDGDPEADEKVDEFVARPVTSSRVKGVDVDFGRPYVPSDYDDSELLAAPPKPPEARGGCKACGGKVIPAGKSKKYPYKPYPAFCKDCKAAQ